MALFEAAAKWIARALEPLVYATLSDDTIVEFVADIGWILPGQPPASLRELGNGLAEVYSALAEIEQLQVQLGASGTDQAEYEAALKALSVRVLSVVGDIHSLRGRLRAELPSDFVAATRIDDEFEGRAFDWLLATDLARHSPVVFRLLHFCGVIDVVDRPEDLAHHQPAFVRIRTDWDRVVSILDDPTTMWRDRYGWGTPVIDGDRLFGALVPLTFALGMPAELRYADPEFAAAVVQASDRPETNAYPQLWVPVATTGSVDLKIVAMVVPASDTTEKPGISVTLVPTGVTDEQVAIGDNWSLRLEGAGQIGSGIVLVLKPGVGPTVLLNPFDSVQGFSGGRAAAWLLQRARPSSERSAMSEPGGTTLEVSSFSVGLGAEGKFATDVKVFAELRMDDCHIAVMPPKDDGLFSEILPASGVTVPFSLHIRWSEDGVHFAGTGSLLLSTPVHASVGPVRVHELRVGVSMASQALAGSATLAASVSVGPVSLTLDGFGLLVEAEAGEGKLGPFDLDATFQFPTGVGVLLTTSFVTGGGFLRLDRDRGRYSGMLELSILGIAVTAIGVMDTRDAEGHDLTDPGFSLLIIMYAEFPAVQLGMGFTLSGVGGLIGIYRDSNYELLKAGLTTGALDSVMFPTDPMASVDKVIRDVTGLFPQRRDRHVLGPMLLLGWGTPTLVTIEVGVLIVFGSPTPVQILGQLSAELPSSAQALIRLNMDVIGQVDFTVGTVRVDAVLRDSSLTGFPLTGEAAVRARWGRQPNLALSFGGFHPDFRPEQDFPDLKRLTLTISEGSKLRLTAESYLAVTSNSVQFGAYAELYAAAAGFSVEGFLEMHMLVILSPFSFAAALAIDVSLKFKGRSFASVGLAFEASGPRPWRAKGKLKIKIAFVTFHKSFNISWGSSTQLTAPPRPVWPDLQAALSNTANWIAILPLAESQDVRVLSRSEEDLVVLHPHGVLEIRQQVVPFDLELDRFGAGVPEGDNRFETPTLVVEGLSMNGLSPVEELFAPGQFLDLTDDEKLSRPSFEAMPAGIRVGSTAVRAGTARDYEVTYETRIVGPDRASRPARPIDHLAIFATEHRLHRLSEQARTRDTNFQKGRYRHHGRQPAIAVEPERYGIAETATGTVGTTTVSSTAAADQAIHRTTAILNRDERNLITVGTTELL
jgi:hypothetical protein